MRERAYVIGLLSGITVSVICCIIFGPLVWPPHIRHAQDVPLPGDAFVVSALVVKKHASPDVEVMACPSGPIAGPMGFMIHDEGMWVEAEPGMFMPIAMEKEPAYFGDPRWLFLGFLAKEEVVE